MLPSESEGKARQEAVHYAKNFRVDSILFMSSAAHLEDPNTLKSLMNQDTTAVAPFLKTYEKFSHARRICDIGLASILNDSSSFPDLVTQKGLRRENYDYILVSCFQKGCVTQVKNLAIFQIGTNFVTEDVLAVRNVSIYNESAYWTDIPQANLEKDSLVEFNEINSRKKCCLVPVKSVQHAYLVKTSVFPEKDYRDFFEDRSKKKTVSVDSFFSEKLAESGIPVMLLNDVTYGQLVNLRNIQEEKLHPELTRIMENHDLWEARYITERVRKTTSKDPDVMPEISARNTTRKGICEDTFNMEMFTEKFAEHMIEEAEFVDNWFESGNNAVYDDRNKRKENVPTTDINLWQYGLEETWMAFINFYLYPRKCLFFPGHPGLDTGGHFFTVRYRWEEQPALKPHFDNSLYSLNVALNQIGKDFEGGGTYFLNQKCSDKTMATGEILAHPGRVTHYHEGLPTTSGTRYSITLNDNCSGY